MRLALSALLASGVLALVVGCASNEDEIGAVVGTTAVERDSSAPPLTPAMARNVLRRAQREWRQTLEASAQNDPAARFENLPEDEFRVRPRMAAGEYGFVVVEARWLEPLQAAPLLVVQSDDPVGFARDTPAILRRLDPQAPVGEDWEGWAFEGIFLEARDTEGVPFLAVFNHWRGSNRGGGEWARGEELYPFPHG